MTLLRGAVSTMSGKQGLRASFVSAASKNESLALRHDLLPYSLYPRAVSRITPRIFSSTWPSFLSSATTSCAKFKEESTVGFDNVRN
jgi:hypothetical protein